MKALLPFFIITTSATIAAQARNAPIIDMHLHALRADANGPPPVAVCPGPEFPVFDPRESWPQTFTAWMKNPRCPNPILGPTTDDSVMSQTLEVLKRRNIFGVTSGPLLDRWREPGGDRIIRALEFSFSSTPLPTPDQVRQWFTERRYSVFAEIGIQYDGVSPSDERFDWTYPHVHLDTGAISFALPRREFHHYLQRIVEAGFGKRVMFGSDQMNWPGVIEPAIDAIESAPFLSAEQKRDILYNNAARFLRLSEAEIAKHHGR